MLRVGAVVESQVLPGPVMPRVRGELASLALVAEARWRTEEGEAEDLPLLGQVVGVARVKVVQRERSPVEVVATPIPVSRVSRSRVTITLVVVPPWTGSPVSGRFSRNATNASPRRLALGS